MKWTLPAGLTLTLAVCGPISDSRWLSNLDLTPPLFLGIRTIDSGCVELLFDEPTGLIEDEWSLEPALSITEILSEGNAVILKSQKQAPGRRYLLKAVAEDENRNAITLIVTFFGFNPQIPGITINEFNPRGSLRHPDKAELKILSDGDMGGVVLYQGTPGSWSDRKVFPSFQVSAGDFIVVHFKSEGIPVEIDETESKEESGGLDASPTAFDFWIAEGKGIPNNNGVLSVYDRPGGLILDGVLFCNRTSESDESYRGFGTSYTMERALELAKQDGWTCSSTRIRPEDGINPDGSSATRTLCRFPGRDTNSAEDWYIVPTGRASFGAENTEEIYEPD